MRFESPLVNGGSGSSFGAGKGLGGLPVRVAVGVCVGTEVGVRVGLLVPVGVEDGPGGVGEGVLVLVAVGVEVLKFVILTLNI